jgi:carbon storage regulator
VLVLKRFVDEVLCIGDDIRITVVRIDPGGGVRLGIDAPKHVPVHRKEVYDAKQEEKRAAARAQEQRGKSQANGSPGADEARVVVEPTGR